VITGIDRMKMYLLGDLRRVAFDLRGVLSRSSGGSNGFGGGGQQAHTHAAV